LQNNYEDFGMRRTVEGVLVVHEHGHPHILMLQIANSFFKLSVFFPLPLCDLECFVLFTPDLGDSRPGDYLTPGEDDVEGLRSRLDERLSPSGTGGVSAEGDTGWEIGDCIAQWWRPSFETFMVGSAKKPQEAVSRRERTQGSCPPRSVFR
jgi:cleavage and polyadenylation specificity factor subunit 5